MGRNEVIIQIKSLLGRILPDEASAFIFGSQARGDSHKDSDWDILILLHRVGALTIHERGKFAFAIYELAANLGIDINPVIYTIGEWEQRSYTPFYQNVKTDAVRIWG